MHHHVAERLARVPARPLDFTGGEGMTVVGCYMLSGVYHRLEEPWLPQGVSAKHLHHGLRLQAREQFL